MRADLDRPGSGAHGVTRPTLRFMGRETPPRATRVAVTSWPTPRFLFLLQPPQENWRRAHGRPPDDGSPSPGGGEGRGEGGPNHHRPSGAMVDSRLAPLKTAENQLKDLNLKVGRAWAAKELFTKFWDYEQAGWARRFFKDWFGWVSRSRLGPMVDVAQMLKRHLENLLTCLKPRITNAVTEGLNSKIQSIKSAARGFRNFKNYRTRILFFCGKLTLYPL